MARMRINDDNDEDDCVTLVMPSRKKRLAAESKTDPRTMETDDNGAVVSAKKYGQNPRSSDLADDGAGAVVSAKAIDDFAGAVDPLP